ncbi:cytochrome P450 [Russula vinacea]|nr:cytochrome P450 [Russula vinacea]
MTAGQWLQFSKWHKKYGQYLIYLNAGGQPIVVINSPKVAVELLDRRGAIYSDRPTNVIVDDIMSRGHLIGFARYGETWRRMRRAANEGFSKSSVKSFYETQTTEAVLLASDLLVSPGDGISTFVVLLHRQLYHVLEAIKDFGIVFSSLLYRVLTWFIFSLVATFPSRNRPKSLAKWKRDAEAWYRQDTALFEDLFHMVEANVSVRGLEGHVCWWCGHEFGQVAWWMLAMLAYPETQARAQAELDAVVGRARLPTFATIQTFPIFVPWSRSHALETYCSTGRATSIHADDWDDLHRKCVAHEPRPRGFGKNTEHFDPARHLDAMGTLRLLLDLKEQGHFTYGFGRRNCVGRYMADNALFINIAVTLWATKIERKKDASGRLLPWMWMAGKMLGWSC